MTVKINLRLLTSAPTKIGNEIKFVRLIAAEASGDLLAASNPCRRRREESLTNE
jgi:hypothetical protein